MAYQVRIMDAILSLNNSANCTVTENNVDKIQWLEGTTPINKTEILNKQNELKYNINRQNYNRTFNFNNSNINKNKSNNKNRSNNNKINRSNKKRP